MLWVVFVNTIIINLKQKNEVFEQKAEESLNVLQSTSGLFREGKKLSKS